MAMNLGGLAADAGATPVGDVFSHAMPDKSTTDKRLCAFGAWMGKAMKEVKDLPLERWRHDGTSRTLRNIAEEHRTLWTQRALFDVQARDGCAIGTCVLTSCLLSRKFVVVDADRDCVNWGTR